jgi:hypothetical protein
MLEIKANKTHIKVVKDAILTPNGYEGGGSCKIYEVLNLYKDCKCTNSIK